MEGPVVPSEKVLGHGWVFWKITGITSVPLPVNLCARGQPGFRDVQEHVGELGEPNPQLRSIPMELHVNLRKYGLLTDTVGQQRLIIYKFLNIPLTERLEVTKWQV